MSIDKILFQGRDNSGNWITSNGVYQSADSVSLWQINGWKNIAPDTLGLFSGFKDMYSDFIFEGNAIAFKQVSENGNVLRKREGVVRLDNGTFEVLSWATSRELQSNHPARFALKDVASTVGEVMIIGHIQDSGFKEMRKRLENYLKDL